MEDETLILILEFLVRQPIPNHTLSALISALPQPHTLSSRLIHSILLRHLTFPFSDKTLTSLELLHQFHNDSNSLQNAYTAVAVYITVKILQNEDVAEFVEAVDRLWRKRIGDLKKGEARGLVSVELRRERRTMEQAIGSELVREELKRRDVSRMAADAVEIFLKQAVEGLGLTGLSVAAEVVRQREARAKGKSNAEVPADNSKLSDKGECSGSGIGNILNQKVIHEKQPVEQGCGNDYAMAEEPLPASAKVPEKSFPTTSKFPCQPRRHEVMTKDPLPEVDTSKTSGEEGENQRAVGIERAPDLNGGLNSTNNSDRNNKIHIDMPWPNAVDMETNQSSPCRSKRIYSEDKGKKPSIMERNSTARTQHWREDSLDSSVEELPILKKKHCRSLQQERKIPATFLPPLNILVGGPVKKEWTLDEEDSLRKAVTELGTSDWNLIRSTYPEFQSRTLEGLRSKWRRMNKKHGLKKL